MIILSYGMPKSASSFIWRLTYDILEMAGHDQRIIKQAYLNEQQSVNFQNLNDDELEIFVKLIPRDQLYLIKTHSRLHTVIERAIDEGKAIATATYRDPLDMIISFLDTGVSERKKPMDQQRKYFADIETLEDAIRQVDNHVGTGERWLNKSHVENIYYKDIMLSPHIVARRISKVVGVEVDSDAVCNKYLSDKSKIIEFNVGGIERWRGVFSESEEKRLKERYASFREKWIV